MAPASVKLSHAVILCTCVGLSSLGAGLVSGFRLAGWFEPARAAERESEPATYTRQEFTDLVRERSRDEVVRVLGKPDRTSQDEEAEYWHYRDRTRDPLTGRTDSSAQLVIRRGRVEVVNY
jgi:hypothetical protein